MRIFDTHCHFQSDILADTTKAISDAKYAGVVKLMNNSISFSDWNKVLIISENNTEVVPALGIHPCFIDLSIESIKTELTLCDLSKYRAIGEIGLDKKKSAIPIESQIEVFELFLKLSMELNIPCSVHCVSAFDELIACLKKFKNHPPVIIHSFSGSMELARSLSKFGCYFSVGRNLNHKRNNKQIEMLKYIFPSLMMLESDSSASNTARNTSQDIHPYCIRDYLNNAAELLTIPPEEIAEKTYKLSTDIFGD
ncbi:MAG TPA: TatD family hydrolase [Spirochaetota bacterium]|nr:TatD family hydrolase [Spirochaetota bacterium]